MGRTVLLLSFLIILLAITFPFIEGAFRELWSTVKFFYVERKRTRYKNNRMEELKPRVLEQYEIAYGNWEQVLRTFEPADRELVVNLLEEIERPQSLKELL